MNAMVKKIFSPEFIFLADGLGAALTATMLGVVLPAFVAFFGMPTTVLYPLAGVAACYTIYSLSCHFLKPHRWQLFLRGIASLNLIYCFASLALMVIFWDSLTAWGVAYFASEKLILLYLIFQESSLAQ